MLGRLFSLEQSAQSATCAASTFIAGVAADRCGQRGYIAALNSLRLLRNTLL